MSTEIKKKELTKQLQELNNRRAEFSETELLALSLKYLSNAGIPPDVVIEYFKAVKEEAVSQNTDIKTVSENFLREIKEHPEKDYFEKKVEKAEEELKNLKEKIRILSKKPAGVY